jgi:nicotinate-nucleotide adenylyltransferase
LAFAQPDITDSPSTPIPAPQRIGICGGTFDPVHFGHLRIAEAAREQLHLSTVLFIPNRNPVHKDHVPAPPEDRFAMLILATQDHPQFEVSRIELDRPTPSYAVETLERLHADHPGSEFFFITGADEILSLRKWKASERLLDLATFVAAPRPGYDLEDLPRRLEPELLERVRLLQMRMFPITSTEIRSQTARGLSVRYETPEAVVRYIRKRGLYRPQG